MTATTKKEALLSFFLIVIFGEYVLMFWVMHSSFMLCSMRSFGGIATLTGKSSDRNSRPSNGREIVKNSQ